MRNEKLYYSTVDILVQSYFNDTLQAGNCTACACGNLIAANNNYTPVVIAGEDYWMKPNGEYVYPKWIGVVGTPTVHVLGFTIAKKQFLFIGDYTADVKKEITSTGYELHEFALIENAFERGYRGRDKMFNGLCAVIDVLDIIHDNKDAAITTSTKQRFVKA